MEERKVLMSDVLTPVEMGHPTPQVNGYMTPVELQKLIRNEVAIRKLIKTYISSHLVEGVDYGKIHIVSKDKCPNYYNCTTPGHYSKDTLFKSGSEKFTSLFHLKPVFERDESTWEVLGKKSGVFCFTCKLVNSSGEVVAEGRGACSVDEKYGQINNAIKIAEKRAQMDAVLRHGGLSDFFAQDLDDMEIPETKSKKKAIEIIPLQISNPVKPVEEIEKMPECVECAKFITKAESAYSQKLYKKSLCRTCQKSVSTKAR